MASQRARDDFLRKRNEATRVRRASSNNSDPLLDLNPFGTAAPPPPSTATPTSTAATASTTTTNSMTQSRREDLLNQARQERDEFLDDIVVQTSPEAQATRSIQGNHANQNGATKASTPSNNGTVSTPSSGIPPAYTPSSANTNGHNGSTTNSNQTSTTSTTATASTVPVNPVESRASFLQTAQRLFSFLNHFSGDDALGPNGELKMPDFAPPPTANAATPPTTTEVAQNATAVPPKKQFNYKAFKEKIKNPHAGEAFKRIKRFVVHFNKAGSNGSSAARALAPPSRSESGDRMRTFLNEVERLMSVNALWCHDDVEEWDNTCEGGFEDALLVAYLFQVWID